jgi:hypothetical protein
MENPDWLVGIRVCRILQVACPSTIIYLTKLYKKLLAILLYACGAVERQQGSKVSVWLQVEAVEVGWLQAEAVEVGGCRQSSRSRLAAGRAVEVSCGAAGRQQGVGLAAGKAAKVED